MSVTELTDREMQVLVGAAEGKENAEIAAGLSLSVMTVKTHMQRVLHKLEARSRGHAVAIAYRSGLLGEKPQPVPEPEPAPRPEPALAATQGRASGGLLLAAASTLEEAALAEFAAGCYPLAAQINASAARLRALVRESAP